MIYLELFLGFLQVGLFSFGGSYSAIPLIRDVVISYGWMNEDMLGNMIAVSESTPGPIMVNLATYCGSTQAGFPGALIATTAVCLPAFIIVLLIMSILNKALNNPFVLAAVNGMKPCIIGIIIATGIFDYYTNCFIAENGIKADLTAIILAAVLSVIYFGSKKVVKRGISPIVLILISGIAGAIVFGL